MSSTQPTLTATSKLKTNPNNPRAIRKDQLDKLVKSLREFPEMLEARPIVVDPDFVVLGGNMRLKAAQLAGLTEVPVYVASWEEAKHKEFIIKDNLAFGEWDWDMLANEWDAEELDDWGLDVPIEEELTEGLTDPDDVPDVPEEPTTRPGDLWILGDHRLLCGDSTKAEDVERLMDGKKADMVFTDPPYGIDVVKNAGTIGGSNKGKAKKYSSVIGDDKPYDPAHIFKSYPATPCVLWGANYFCHALPEIGKWFVWDKDRGEGTTFSDCELAWSNLKGVVVKKYTVQWDGMRREGEQGERVHPTQKPILLCEKMISELMKGSLVVDLFLGSGSTLIAAEKIGRKCYGMELDPKYCDVIVKRWEDFTGKKAELWKQ